MEANEMIQEGTKKCARCGRELSFDKFSKKKGGKFGLQDYCKECINEYNRVMYAKRKENDLKMRELKMKVADSGSEVRDVTHLHKVFENPELAKFTPRELIKELRARGYRGTLEFVQTIKI